MSGLSNGFSLLRVWLIAGNTLRESIRQRLFALMVVFSIGILATSQLFRDVNFAETELKFIADFGFGTITLFGSILAVVVTVQTLFGELENRTALTLLAKPVYRSEFILGKFLGVAAILAIFTVVVTVCLVAVLVWREHAIRAGGQLSPAQVGGILYGNVWAFSALQMMKFALIAAIALLIGSYSNTNLFTMVMTFCVLVIGHLQYLALEAWRALDSAMARIAGAFVSFVFPNFQLFNLGDQVASGGGWPVGVFGSVALYSVIYTAVILGLAVFSMNRREI